MKKTINGISVNYECVGEGDVLLLLHGWMSDTSLFADTIRSMSSTHNVIAIDLPGFGLSDPLTSAWSVDDYTDFIIEFIKSLGIKKLSVLGHSYGGRIILKLASRGEESNTSQLPFELDKLIIVDGAGIKSKKKLKTKLKECAYKMSRRALTFSFMQKLYPNGLEKLRKRFGSADYKNASPIMRETLVLAVNEDLTPLLPKIKCPTLLIWGENDTATPMEHAKIMEKNIPDAGIVMLKGAGHFSYLEQPGIYLSVLHSFLDTKEAQ